MTLYSTLRRSTKPIKPFSAKRLSYEDDLDAMRPLVHERSKGRCEARIVGVCTGRAQEVHHRQSRGRQGSNDLANLLDLCWACHAWAHNHGIRANAWGLLVASHEDPAEVPVLVGRTP